MVFVDKKSLFEGYFVLFYQGMVIEVWPLFTGGLYSEVAFNTGFDCKKQPRSQRDKVFDKFHNDVMKWMLSTQCNFQ